MHLQLDFLHRHTPLINELLHRLSEHPDFEQYFKAKQIPKAVITAICNDLKSEEIYQNQPGRFYTSAIPSGSRLFDHLFKAYDETTDRLESCALAYLLKNNCFNNKLKIVSHQDGI